MSQVIELAVVSESAIDNVLASYQRLPPALRALPKPVLAVALGIAQGNSRRLVADGDGAVTVLNHPAW